MSIFGCYYYYVDDDETTPMILLAIIDTHYWCYYSLQLVLFADLRFCN